MQSNLNNEGKFGGKVFNYMGNPILFTGIENLTKIEEQFDNAMISMGFGPILGKDDGREPVLCALNESRNNTSS